LKCQAFRGDAGRSLPWIIGLWTKVTRSENSKRYMECWPRGESVVRLSGRDGADVAVCDAVCN